MRRSVPLSVLPLLPVLLLSACSGERAASPAPALVRAVGPGATPTAAPEEVAQDPTDVALDGLTAPVDPQQKAVEDSWLLPDPRGKVPQIALRFVQALQHGDDVAALRELTSQDRFTLSFTDAWQLHVVMNDVRRHAGLATAGRCTRAAQIARASAVVTCGRRRVVLSVGVNTLQHGVSLSEYTAHYDVYRGPHTHAYSTILF